MTLTEKEQRLASKLREIIDRYNHTEDREDAFIFLGFNIFHYFDLQNQFHRFQSTDEYLFSKEDWILWINNIDGITILYKLEQSGEKVFNKDNVLDMGDNSHCKSSIGQENMSFYRNHNDMQDLYIEEDYGQQQIYKQIEKWGI